MPGYRTAGKDRVAGPSRAEQRRFSALSARALTWLHRLASDTVSRLKGLQLIARRVTERG